MILKAISCAKFRLPAQRPFIISPRPSHRHLVFILTIVLGFTIISRNTMIPKRCMNFLQISERSQALRLRAPRAQSFIRHLTILAKG